MGSSKREPKGSKKEERGHPLKGTNSIFKKGHFHFLLVFAWERNSKKKGQIADNTELTSESV